MARSSFSCARRCRNAPEHRPRARRAGLVRKAIPVNKSARDRVAAVRQSAGNREDGRRLPTAATPSVAALGKAPPFRLGNHEAVGGQAGTENLGLQPLRSDLLDTAVRQQDVAGIHMNLFGETENSIAVDR